MFNINSLNEEQQKAVNHLEGPVSVIAGAGSGKTRVLTSRYINLINNNISPYNILAVTFTNKAANEMKERIQSEINSNAYLWVSTFHSFAVRILRTHIDKLGYSKDFVILSEYDKQKVIRDIIKNKLKLSTDKYKPKYIASYFKKIKLDIEFYSPDKDIALSVFRHYKIYCKKNSTLDFDDLLEKLVLLFKKHKDVLESYQDQFKYIMIDEFQDTNDIQLELVLLLASKHKNVFIVGDEDQSIYSFRGAISPENINKFSSIFRPTVYKLVKNYRSTKSILNGANSLIRNNPVRNEKNLISTREDDRPISYYKTSTETEEANYIVNKIISLKKQGYKLNDIAILYRINSLSRKLEDVLKFKNVSYKLIGGMSFYERKEVKDLIFYLQLILNTDNNLAFKNVVNTPKRGIGLTTMEKLESYADSLDTSLFNCISEDMTVLPKGTVFKLIQFKETIIYLKSIINDIPLYDYCCELLKKTEYLSQYNKNNIEDLSRLENIEEFKNIFKEKELILDGTSKNLDFLNELLSDFSLSSKEESKLVDSISLMTIHSAKGLEFNTVFLAGFEENILPSYMSLNEANGVEEERRLTYVAMTRAMDKLYITSSTTRMNNGRTISNPVSRFLSEIDESTYTHENKINTSFSYSSNTTYKSSLVNNNTITNSDTEYKEGMKVNHTIYGEGVIVKVPEGSTLSIAFKEGVKTLMKGHNSYTIIE